MRNQERDQQTWRQLEAKGWYVIVVWECELKRNQLADTVARVSDTIKENGREYILSLKSRREAREAYRLERASKRLTGSRLLEEIRSIQLPAFKF